jgi:hypothetical protein
MDNDDMIINDMINVGRRIKKALRPLTGEDIADIFYRTAREREMYKQAGQQEKEMMREHCVQEMACLELGKKNLTPDEAAYAELKQKNLMRTYKEML